jgi:hypothetical protein
MKDWFEENINPDVAKALIRLRVDLGDGRVVERDFRPDLKIDYEMLEEDLQQTPQAFAFWAAVYSEQKAVVAKLERKAKRRRAIMYQTIIEETKKEQWPKVPEKIFKELVEKDEELLKIELSLTLANRTMGKLFNIVDAIKMKSDHLRSLAGFKREEQRNP